MYLREGSQQGTNGGGSCELLSSDQGQRGVTADHQGPAGETILELVSPGVSVIRAG